MATAPQPLRPPVPPPPPRTGRHMVTIALLILALIILVSIITVSIGLRFLSRTVQVHVDEGGRGKKEVSIKTPVGSLEVKGDVNEARLGLPIYPGAKRLNDKGSATVNIELAGESNVRVVAARFETPDPLDKVRAFYQERLGSESRKFAEKTPEGRTVFELKQSGESKIVVLKSVGVGTHIELVHVKHGSDTTN